ncbi:hypothetical protein ACOSP7_020667 [Xanthoceras sorbifolium]
MVLVLLVGHSTASFGSCYMDCYLDCLYEIPGRSPAFCMRKCVDQCPASLGILKNTQYFCNIGCASSVCAKLTSKNKLAAEKVKDCVDSCSTKCNDKF